jgi:tripartite-type tricarboxylate transporter receptor subunit TctC
LSANEPIFLVGSGSTKRSADVYYGSFTSISARLMDDLPHVNEALLKSRPLYDPVKGLDPIAGLAVINLALAVHPSVPAQNLKEFVTYAKTHTGRLSYAHVGVGSTPQLIGEMFKLLAGLPELVQAPYRGAGRR